ncbi:MAG: BrnA antitoxin family protein, partial [Rickettsiales bacterium]
MPKQKTKKLKAIPKFANEDEEAEFWLAHDTTDYIDWSKGKKEVLPNLKLSTKSISLRLPSGLLNNIKILANKKDVPYQSLMKIMLDNAVTKELH